jgi:adenosine deaminase
MQPSHQKKSPINMYKKIIDFIQDVPKTELHIHFEAIVPPSVLQQYGIMPKIDITLGGDLFGKFNEYLKHIKNYIIKDGNTNKLTKFKEVMEVMFEYIFEDRLKQNIMFTQFQYSGLKMYGKNKNIFNEPETGLTLLDQASIINNVLNTFKENPKYKPVFIEFILEIPRGQAEVFESYTYKDYITDINTLLRYPENKYFKGVGLGGRDEHSYNIGKFSHELLRVRHFMPFGIINPHAGEFGFNSKNLEETVDIHPERIGHGIQIINFNSDSNNLIEKSKKLNISYDVCITSNINFIRTMTYKTHPIYKMIEQGLNVNLSTDDPILLGTDMEHPLTLMDEYKHFVYDGIFADDKSQILNLINIVNNGWKAKGVNKDAYSKYYPQVKRMSEELATFA